MVRARAVIVFIVTFTLFPFQSAQPSPQFLTTEATYIMGDGETPSFAESMALQKAKQLAVEQAGTYLQSITTIQQHKLTSDEIQTIAGGLIKVEVLEKKRTIVEDGIRVAVKIRAAVDADMVQTLAERMQGKGYGDEYKKLKADYERLSSDIEKWKSLIAKASPGPERDTALAQIREREKTLARLQQNEIALFQRLVSGEALFARAQAQLESQQQEQTSVVSLVKKILASGYEITLGEPSIKTSLAYNDRVLVQVPVTLALQSSMRNEIQDHIKTHGWEVYSDIYQLQDGRGVDQYGSQALVFRPGTDPEIQRYFQTAMYRHRLVLIFELDNGQTKVCMDKKSPMLPSAEYEAGQSQMALVRYGLAPVGVFDGFYIYHFGLSPRLIEISETSKKNVTIQRMLQRDKLPGFIALFDEPRMMIMSMAMKMEAAKHLRSIRAKLTENEQYQNNDYCSIEKQVTP